MRRNMMAVLSLILVCLLISCAAPIAETTASQIAGTTTSSIAGTTEAKTYLVTLNYQIDDYMNVDISAEQGQTLDQAIKGAKVKNYKIANGFDFTNWYTDSALTQTADLNVIPSSNITLYAGWVAWSAIISGSEK